MGNRSAKTFAQLWKRVRGWQSYFSVTDGYKVYPMFISDGEQIVDKTYMTRVEGENTRLRPYLARLHRQTLCYSKSEEMLRYSLRLLLHYLKCRTIPLHTNRTESLHGVREVTVYGKYHFEIEHIGKERPFRSLR